MMSEIYQVSQEGVIFDAENNLKWLVGPDKDINHYDAERWVENLTVAGGKWRLPTIAELHTLYQRGVGKCNVDPLFNISLIYLWVWSSELLDKNNKLSEDNNSPRVRNLYFRECLKKGLAMMEKEVSNE